MIWLREHQYNALCKLRNGNILCGRVGSGKSLTSLGYYYAQNGGKFNTYRDVEGVFHAEFQDHGMPNPCDLYIITTAAVRDKHSWDRELLRLHMATDPEINSYHNHIVIDSWNNINKYVGVSHAMFIFDEQRVVGSGAWVKAFYKITAKNQWILLSATPGDRWVDYIPVFVANGFYRNKTEFVHEHVIYNYHVDFPQITGYLSEKKLERFRKQILVDIEYVPDTTQHHTDIIVPYDRELYRWVCKERKNPYEQIKVSGRIMQKPIANASEFCSILRKVVNSDPNRIANVVSKARQFDKVIIFYNFDFELDILRKADWGDQYTICEWNGHIHQPIPNTKHWIYLVQYNAGSEGWNCTETNAMMFFSDSYSYRQMEQAAGRIDRSDTSFKDLYYYHFRSTANIDLAIHRALSQKKKFNAAAFANRYK